MQARRPVYNPRHIRFSGSCRCLRVSPARNTLLVTNDIHMQRNHADYCLRRRDHVRTHRRIDLHFTHHGEPLPNLPVARAVWEPAPSLAVSAACWLAAGAAHHTVLSTALSLEAWQDFARIAEVELAVIDEDSSVDNFEKELRWNAVYHRISQQL